MINSTRCAILAKQACATFSQVVQKITPPIANNFLKFFFALFATLTLNAATAWAEEYTINFGYSNWDGVTASFSGSDKDEVTQTVYGVVVTYTRNGASLYANNTALRLYKSNTLKFDAPTGSTITAISFSCTKFQTDITSTPGTCTATASALSWSGDASSVTFTRPSSASSYAQITSATVTLTTSAGGEDPGTGGETPNPGTDGETTTVTYVLKDDPNHPDNGVDWFSGTIDEYTGWTATKGTNDNPKYYNTGTGLRVYSGGKFTITSTKVMLSITLTFASGSYTFSASNTTNPQTVTPNAKSYEWSVGRACRLQKIEITYAAEASGETPEQLAAPTGLTAEDITSNSATLSWNEVANMTKYEVTITDDHDYTETFTVTDEIKSVSSLSPSTTYYWTVQAIGDGTSYTDSEASQHTFTTTAASTPEPGTGGEEIGTATLTFDNTSKRIAFTNKQQVWTENGVTLTNDKASSASDVADYYQPARFYKNSKINITHTSKKITQIVFDCKTEAYANDLSSAIGEDKVSQSSDKVTLVFENPQESFNIQLTAGQVQMDALTVTYQISDEPETPEPETPTPDEEYISGKWKLVDATSKLQAGMEIIIASVAEEGAIKTMAEQKTSNRGAVASSLDGEYLKPAVETTLITLEVNESYKDLFALKTEDGYLYAASSSSNHLKSQSGTSINAFWEIKITDGEASIVATESSNHNVMQYNPNNGAPLFSCYVSASQKPITIYSKVYDVTATAENGSVSGTGTYYQGNSVTLKATADFDYEFVNWTVDGEVVSTDNPYKFQVTADVELVAKFQEIAATTEALSGKFSTGKYEYAEFATGNLQYKPSTDTWRFAKQQYQYVGKDNIYVGKEDYKGWIDLFGWSADDKFGVNSSNDNANYQGEFVDWGKLFPEEGWSTLSKNQWYYLLNQRTNAASLKQIAMVGETLGIMLFPDEWTLPAGCAPTQQTHHDEEDGEDHSCDFVSYNYTLAHWTELEKAGAIFLPAAGRRTGGWGNETISPHMIGKAELDADRHYKHYADYYAYYWTSTKTDGKVNYLINCTLVDKVKDTYTVHAGHVNWAEEARYGQSVRLAKVTNTLIQLGDNDNSEVIEANADKTVNVQVNRTFANDGYYYTLCLPFDLDAKKIGKALQISSVTENVAEQGMNVVFTEAETLLAGQPYLVLPSENLTNPIFEGVKIVDTEGETTETVSGAGINITFTGIINGVGEQTNGTTHYYVGNKGYLYNKPTAKLGLRAFFTITDAAGQEVKNIRARVVTREDAATGFENITNSENTTIKVIENGQLIIIRNGEKFNAQGQKL